MPGQFCQRTFYYTHLLPLLSKVLWISVWQWITVTYILPARIIMMVISNMRMKVMMMLSQQTFTVSAYSSIPSHHYFVAISPFPLGIAISLSKWFWWKCQLHSTTHSSIHAYTYVSQRWFQQWSSDLSQTNLSFRNFCFGEVAFKDTIRYFIDTEWKRCLLFPQELLNWNYEDLKLSLVMSLFPFNNSFIVVVIKPMAIREAEVTLSNFLEPPRSVLYLNTPF